MKRITALVAAALLLILFFAVNVIANETLRGARLDMTEADIYTLSDASKRIARSPEERVTLRSFVSKDLLRDDPRLAGYVSFVEEKLRAFERASKGRVDLEIIEPEPQSEAEDEAFAEGLQPLPTQEGNAFFGLVGTNTLDGREIIPIFNFQDQRFEAFLEFEIARLIDRLGTEDLPRIGLITDLPLRGGRFDPRTGRQGQPQYQLITELETQFEIVDIDSAEAELPENLDALLVVHPKELPEQLAYAIDQYLLAGGEAAFFLDPLCESDPAGQDPRNPMAAMGADRSSAQIPTLDAWGVGLRDGAVAGDLASALELPARQGGGTVRALQYLRLGDGETVAEEDPVTGRLGTIILGAAGMLERSEDASVEWTPLLQTSEQAAPLSASRLTPFTDPRDLLADFQAEGRFPLAVRIRGERVPSAFPDGPPAEATDADGADGEEEDTEAEAAAGGHLAESTGPVSAVVVADADMLADRFWIREVSLGGLSLGYERLSDNGAFAINVLDQMAGSGELIELRARGDFFRPLTKLQEMQQAADAAIAAQTAALDERIAEAQQRINEIQQGRTDAGEITSLYLTPEQEDALEEARQAIAEAREERREIRYELNQDIESLETRLTLINTALVPGLLCALAIGLGGYRAVRRRADRRRGSDRS